MIDDASTRDLLSLRMLYRAGLLMDELQIPTDLNDALVLTAKGDTVLLALNQALPALSEHEIRFVVFLIFSLEGEDLIQSSTDLRPIESVLDTAIRQRIIRFPYIYRRLLYNKAFELFHHPDELGADESKLLLNDTPQGFCQYGNYIAGNMGLMRSKASRLISSQKTIPLWHCQNVSCGYFHKTTFTSPSKQIEDWYWRGLSVLTHAAKRRNEEDDLRRRLSDRVNYYDDFWHADLHGLLANGFSLLELKAISKQLEDKHGKSFRKHEINRRALDRRDDQVGAVSSDLQLCMLADDSEVAASLDELVFSHEIQIPESEIRTSMIDAPGSWQDVHTECSSLGVRVVGGHSSMMPLARLRRLVLELCGGNETDLAWMLRKSAGASIGEKLESCIYSEEPNKVLQRFMLDSPTALKAGLDHIRAAHLRIPANDGEENTFIETVCWKLGFPRKRFGSAMEMLRSRLTLFKNISAASFPTDEEWKEQVRSIGVNLFVSLEEVLELTLSFTVWLLLSDHLNEKHLFNLRKARLLTAKEISGVVNTEKGPVEFKSDVKNTLFPLMMGFVALGKRVQHLMEEGSRKFEKPLSHLPFWSSKSTLQLLPYRHRYFIFDMESEDRRRLLELISRTAKRLLDSNVLSVRNNVPHLSYSFPSRDEIRECCQTLDEVLSDLESYGLIPVLFATSKIYSDSWRHRRVDSVDYRGRTISWTVSASAACLHKLPSLTDPQIIVTGVKLPGTAEPIRLSVQEDSAFSDLWDDYPKRKIPEALEGEKENKAIH